MIVVREKQRVLTHICGILENGTDKRTRVQSRNRDTEKKHTVTKGWKEGGMNREMRTDTYTPLRIQRGFPGGTVVKNQEMWVPSQGRENPLE